MALLFEVGGLFGVLGLVAAICDRWPTAEQRSVRAHRRTLRALTPTRGRP